MFGSVDNDGRTIHLENIAYVRSARRSFSRGTVPIAAFMDTYRTMEPGEYRAGRLQHYREAVFAGLMEGAAVGFGTISLSKNNVCHSVGLLVNFESRQVEVLDSRGCDMNNQRQCATRRGYYSKQALSMLHGHIVCVLFPSAHMFTCLPMDQRFPVLQQVTGACRLGVLVYLFHRLAYPNAPRAMLYRRVLRSTRLA